MYVVGTVDRLLLTELNFPTPGITGSKTELLNLFVSLYLHTQVTMFKQAESWFKPHNDISFKPSSSLIKKNKISYCTAPRLNSQVTLSSLHRAPGSSLPQCSQLISLQEPALSAYVYVVSSVQVSTP